MQEMLQVPVKSDDKDRMDLLVACLNSTDDYVKTKICEILVALLVYTPLSYNRTLIALCAYGERISRYSLSFLAVEWANATQDSPESLSYKQILLTLVNALVLTVQDRNMRLEIREEVIVGG